MVNLFGKGFVGSRYNELYPCIVNDRNDLTVKTNEILYMISTTDNYNIHTNPYLDIETNLTTLIRVLENCKGVKDVVFNFISSWFVYGSSLEMCGEESPCDPKGFYSITKRTAEQMLIEYCETFDIKYRILRLANVVGPGDKGAGKKKNVLSYLIREIVKGNDIHLHADGNFYRNYIHVDDVCHAINIILQKGEYNTIYNVGNGYSKTLKEMIRYVLYKTNSTSKVYSVDAKVESFFIDTTKIQSLGYNPKFDMTQILDDLIQEAVAKQT